MLLAFVPGWIWLFSHAVSASVLQSISAQTLNLPPENFTFVESFADPPVPSTQNASLVNATAVENIRCHGIRYGFNPNVDDCISALRYIQRGWQLVSFGDRQNPPSPEIFPLPLRFMGDKALCYFQPILQVGTTVGTASFNEIRIAASALLSQCASDEGQGGIATGIGGNGNLALILGTYSPNIQCSGTIRNRASCSDIMNSMDVTSTNVMFGNGDDPSTQVILPNTLSSSDDKCFAQISMTGARSDSSTWYKMWEAFTALLAVCGKHVQGGIYGGLGDHGQLSLRLYGPPSSVDAA